MKSIMWGFALGVALLGLTSDPSAAQWQAAPNLSLVSADSIVVPEVLKVFEPGVPVRARFAECGDERRPVVERTGTFMKFQPDAFTMETRSGAHTQIHQVAIDDLLRLDVGIERSLTKRGAWIGGLAGTALGLLAVGLADAAGDNEIGGGEYAGASLFGLAGAGVGALIGNRNTTTEWRTVPLYGDAYCQ
ncbi:MAG TPA: hypothetical protein VFH69_06470 [Gemmatimonadota bacterium]|nr:hypothetical protein [Gemmatimonadota bacterium]